MSITRNQNGIRKHEKTMLVHSMTIASTLARTLMAPVVFNARRDGPNQLWFSSHASNRGLERAKHGSARMRKIVVGMIGKNAPMIPRPVSRLPSANSNILIRPHAIYGSPFAITG